jgi:hypothetical protein
MPSNLESIIQRMIDAGESEENIATVIREHNRKGPTPTTFRNEPTTFTGGVGKSLASGEALKAGMEGGLGWLKGATLDLPGNIIGGATGLAKLGANAMMGPFGGAPQMGQEMMSIPGQLADITMRAGSDPETFGRTVGQATGQPLAAAGVGAVAKPAAVMAGRGIEAVGRGVAAHKPVSGLFPRMFDSRTLRGLEGGAGRGIERIGETVRNLGTPTVQGEIMPPDFLEGQIIPRQPPPVAPPPLGLPPSTTDIFQGPSRTPVGRALPPATDIDPMANIVGRMDSPVTPHNIPPVPQTPRPPIQVPPSTNPERALPPAMLGPSSQEELIMRMQNPSQRTINASGESAASMEAINRQASMKATKKQFVVYDKAGNKRPLIGPDAVDYVPKKGETYGIESPGGFQVLENKGGKVPSTPASPTTATTAKSKLAGPKGTPAGTYRVSKDKVTPEFLTQSKANGFQFVGTTPMGDYLFRRF